MSHPVLVSDACSNNCIGILFGFSNYWDTDVEGLVSCTEELVYEFDLLFIMKNWRFVSFGYQLLRMLGMDFFLNMESCLLMLFQKVTT